MTPGNERILEALRGSAKPIVLLLNKIDQLKNKQGLLLQLKAYSDVLGERMAAAVPISAYKGDGLEKAVVELARALPEGPAFFEPDQLTDASEQSVAAEFVREKVMLATKDELPYSAAVTLDQLQDDRPSLVKIMATIHVERDSQKPIVIGKHGERIKRIGTGARRDLEFFFDSKVYLELHVRVTGEWSSTPRGLAELGYSDDRPAVAPGVDLAALAELTDAEQAEGPPPTLREDIEMAVTDNTPSPSSDGGVDGEDAVGGPDEDPP